MDTQIFTMPEQYRHGKEVKVVEPVKEQKAAPAPVSVPPPPPKPIAPVPPHLIKKQNHTALIFAGVIVVIALVIAGYLLLRSAQKQTPASTQEPEVTQPTARPPVETPVVEEESKPESPQEIESPFAAPIIPGIDSDSDGLTDSEETSVYQTDPQLPDTDADGFLDGNEVFHRYNPKGTAPGTLLEAGIVSLQQHEGMRVFVPVLWKQSVVSDSVTKENVFQVEAESGEQIHMVVTPVTQEFSVQMIIQAWKEQQEEKEKILTTKTKRQFDLYLTGDKRHALVVLDGLVVKCTYQIGTKTTVDFLQTFLMMINSVERAEAI